MTKKRFPNVVPKADTDLIDNFITGKGQKRSAAQIRVDLLRVPLLSHAVHEKSRFLNSATADLIQAQFHVS